MTSETHAYLGSVLELFVFLDNVMLCFGFKEKDVILYINSS